MRDAFKALKSGMFFHRRPKGIALTRQMWPLIFVMIVALGPAYASKEKPSLKVFILAGDHNVLEQAPINGATLGVEVSYYANAKPVPGELKNHVNCAVYHSRWDIEIDFDSLTPVATGLVEIGEQRSKRIYKKKKGRGPIPFKPFPQASDKEDHTTAIRGYISVPTSGRYMLQPGRDVSAFNVTHVDGQQVYLCWGNYGRNAVKAVYLEKGRRYPFRTVFCDAPGHAFRTALLNRPGALQTVVDRNRDYAFLMDDKGRRKTRDDVVIYDMHSVHNNDRTPGRRLGVGDVPYGGKPYQGKIGPALMLGHVLGNHFKEPVLLLRFATHPPKSLAHDYCPPSSDGAPGMEGSWDAIRFSLENLYRVHQGYAGMKPELSGLLWFQGIQDSRSGDLAAGYRQHLGNLIRDLRKDIGAKLPVVVASIGSGGNAMNEAEKVVFDAQMNVSTQPEFKGKVLSIDTRAFFPLPARSPSRDRLRYCNNAEAYLKIGESMGAAMIRLVKGQASR